MARRYLDNGGRYDRPIFADGGQYLIKRGDTLWDLSKKYLGDPFKYKELAKLNNIKNPDLIYAGRYLTLPDGKIVDTQTDTVVTPETSKVIANHDKLYDYKIEDGKLYTRRKNSDTGWVDISNNNDARAKIEHFTNIRIEDTKNKNNNNVADANKVASDSTQNTIDSLRVAKTDSTQVKANASTSPNKDVNITPYWKLLSIDAGANDQTNDGGLSYYWGNGGHYYISPKSLRDAKAINSDKAIGEFIYEGLALRPEFKRRYMRSNQFKKDLIDPNIDAGAVPYDSRNVMVSYAIPQLDALYYLASNSQLRNHAINSKYIDWMKKLGIDVYAPENRRFYPR